MVVLPALLLSVLSVPDGILDFRNTKDRRRIKLGKLKVIKAVPINHLCMPMMLSESLKAHPNVCAPYVTRRQTSIPPTLQFWPMFRTWLFH
jgi:hypothetical protein